MFMSICVCLHAAGLVHACLLILHKPLTDGEVQEMAQFSVNSHKRTSSFAHLPDFSGFGTHVYPI